MRRACSNPILENIQNNIPILQNVEDKNEIKKEKEEKKEIIECKICYENLLDKDNHSIIFSPCGHEICKKCTLKKKFTKCCFCNSNILSKRKIVTKLKGEENLICKGCNFSFNKKERAPHSLSKCGHHLCKECTDEKRIKLKVGSSKNYNHIKGTCCFKKCKSKLVLEDLQPIIYHKKFLDEVLINEKDKIKINNKKFDEDFKKDPDFVKKCFDNLQKDLDFQNAKNTELYGSYNMLNNIVNKTKTFDNYINYQKSYIQTFNTKLNKKLQDDIKIKQIFKKIEEFNKIQKQNKTFANLFNNIKKKYEKEKKINFEDFTKTFFYLKSISSKNYLRSEISKKLFSEINFYVINIFKNKIKTLTMAFSKFLRDSTINFNNIFNLKENNNFEKLSKQFISKSIFCSKINFKEIGKLNHKYRKNLFLDCDNNYLSFEICKKKIDELENGVKVKKKEIVEVEEDDIISISDLFG